MNKKNRFSQLVKKRLDKLVDAQEKSIQANDSLSEEQKNQIALETTKYFLGVSQTVWNVALITIPLDYILIEFSAARVLPEIIVGNSLGLFIFLCVLTSLFSFRDRVTEVIHKIYKTVEKHPNIKTWIIFITAVVTLTGMIAEFVINSSTEFISIAMQLVVYSGVLYSILGGKTKNLPAKERFVTLLRRDLFIANILPIMTARLALPVGIIALQVTDSQDQWLSLTALLTFTVLAIIDLTPVKENFFTRCRRCAITVPIRLLTAPVCLRCETKLDTKGRIT